MFPRAPHRPPRDTSDRPWQVDYLLAYDDGPGEWTKGYRTRWGALVASWWHYHIASWGGVVVLRGPDE